MQDPVGELPPENQAAPLTPAALSFCAALVGELGAHVYERIVQLGHITVESFCWRAGDTLTRLPPTPL